MHRVSFLAWSLSNEMTKEMVLEGAQNGVACFGPGKVWFVSFAWGRVDHQRKIRICSFVDGTVFWKKGNLEPDQTVMENVMTEEMHRDWQYCFSVQKCYRAEMFCI